MFRPKSPCRKDGKIKSLGEYLSSSSTSLNLGMSASPYPTTPQGPKEFQNGLNTTKGNDKNFSRDYFEIQNFSDFRKVIQYMQHILTITPAGTRGATFN